MTKAYPSRRPRAGFTLFEILIVIALIGLLATLVITQVGNLFPQAEQDIARTFVKTTLKTPLFSYKRDVGHYPSTEEGLRALITAPANAGNYWRGPYITENKVPEDPWRHPYQYRYPSTKGAGDGYDLYSIGPDGIEGNEDDIGNWQ